MTDWLETPSGRFVNLALVFAADEEDDGSIRLYADNTPKVYSGGTSFYDADAVFIRDQLRIRSSIRANYVKESLALYRAQGGDV